MADLLNISSRDELAQFCGAGYSSYRDLESDVFSVDIAYRYVEFDIPKKDGRTRTISAPRRKLKAIQRSLAAGLCEVYRPPKAVHGFVPVNSIVTNAKAHVGRRIILNIDLEDFFHSIRFERIRGLFMAPPFSYSAALADVVARLCCHDGHLPMGAPTSPILSNMVCRTMDQKLATLATKHFGRYTRYADDITFSFDCREKDLPSEIVSMQNGEVVLGPDLLNIIRNNRFRVNHRKVRIASRGRRQEVTGLTVNTRVNVPRRYLRRTEAMLHAWKKHRLAGAQQHFEMRLDSKHWASHQKKSFQHVLHGRLAYLHAVRGVDDPRYARLATLFNTLSARDGLTLTLPLPPPSRLRALCDEMIVLSPGRTDAYSYQRAVAALMTELWRDQLTYRGIEKDINEGRKRIDIVYVNDANEGFLLWVGRHHQASHVLVECKNYTNDPGNAEIDQLAGRFTPRRSEFGIMACRTVSERQVLQARARDIADAGRGFIIILDDDDFCRLVDLAEAGKRADIDDFLRARFDLLVM